MPDNLLGQLSDFAFGRNALRAAGGGGAPADPGPDKGPVDPAALLKRNTQSMEQKQQAAGDKARAKAIVSPKTAPAKSTGRKTI